MIVPMQKYHFIIHHADRIGFIHDLMDIGVLHIDQQNVPDDHTHSSILNDLHEARQVHKAFQKKIKKKTLPVRMKGNLPSIAELAELEKKRESIQHQLDKLDTEIKLVTPWGEFDWNSIGLLEQKTGVQMRFFQHPKKSFKEQWLSLGPIQVVKEKKGMVYFVFFQREGEELDFPTIPLSLPKKSLSELKLLREEHTEELKKLDGLLDSYAHFGMNQLEDMIASMTDHLSFHQATNQMEANCEDHLFLIEGWCPEPQSDQLEQYLEKNKIVYVKKEGVLNDRAPVLLKNNRFSRLFEPIGNLFSLPNYGELDMTLFFAPFFFLFFGFCLGDAGYGLVLLLISTLLKFTKYNKWRDILSLVQLLGISTAIMGFISGTLFGFEMVSIPFFEEVKYLFLSKDQMFNLALIVGFVQIIFALSLNVFKQIYFKGWLYGLSRIGWIILLCSLVDLYIAEWGTHITQITVWVGVGLIVLFGAPREHWLKSVGLGLADLYNLTGVMGDLLSYIRLFALGVSSSILGLVINSIAWEARGIPYAGVVIYIVILVVGHGANLALASLSAFVHPMRLTFVEFYKNAGFEGGGLPYQPLARKSKTSNHSSIK